MAVDWLARKPDEVEQVGDLRFEVYIEEEDGQAERVARILLEWEGPAEAGPRRKEPLI